jgi:hypothetical protein
VTPPGFEPVRTIAGKNTGSNRFEPVRYFFFENRTGSNHLAADRGPNLGGHVIKRTGWRMPFDFPFPSLFRIHYFWVKAPSHSFLLSFKPAAIPSRHGTTSRELVTPPSTKVDVCFGRFLRQVSLVRCCPIKKHLDQSGPNKILFGPPASEKLTKRRNNI